MTESFPVKLTGMTLNEPEQRAQLDMTNFWKFSPGRTYLYNKLHMQSIRKSSAKRSTHNSTQQLPMMPLVEKKHALP